MKSTIMTCIASISLFLAAPLGLVAQEKLATQPTSYTITDLGTLSGGSFSQPFFMNKYGLISGSSSLTDGNQNAVLWLEKLKLNIGAPGLGGPNSIAFGNNQMAQASGEAENSKPDPNGEDFCGFGTHLTCLPFLWQVGKMTQLPTLGGNNGVAKAISDQQQIVGFAENSTPDPNCPAPQVLEFKPVIWEKGLVHQLPTADGDPEGVAYQINDKGQVVGGSGTCAAFNENFLYNLVPVHALLWENGQATDLGNLGGQTGAAGGNIAYDINNQGEAVGVSDLAGDTTFDAFLWTKSAGMQDLGTLSGDVASASIGINDAGSVVGISLDADFNPRAFLWQNGMMTDLNTLVSNSPLYLLSGCSINSRGEITGLGMTSTGDIHTFLATPNDDAATRPSNSADAVTPMLFSRSATSFMRLQK